MMLSLFNQTIVAIFFIIFFFIIVLIKKAIFAVFASFITPKEYTEKELQKKISQLEKNKNRTDIMTYISITIFIVLCLFNNVLFFQHLLIQIFFRFYCKHWFNKKIKKLEERLEEKQQDEDEDTPPTQKKQNPTTITQNQVNAFLGKAAEPRPKPTPPELDPVPQPTTPKKQSQNTTADHQTQLDRYINTNHSSAEIGKIYERQIGYMLEQKGYQVIYHGIMRGVEDEGIDLIAKRNNQILLIQAKNWSENRPIRENQINQFKGSADFFVSQNHKKGLQWAYVFISTQTVSERAAQVAQQHKIKLIVQPLNKQYPMIKCKVNKQEQTKIYHLPTDQQYDKIIIKPQNGDCYAHSVSEAEFKGFRRAYRWRGNQT